MREATSIKKGWVAVGLVLLVSALASFQVFNSPVYAQTTENDTLDTSSLTDLPSNLLQSQLEPKQDSLIATPGLSADDLNPSQQDPSIIGGDERDQQTPTIPNTETSSENVADEQSLDTDETIENSIVQKPVPKSEQLESSQPEAGEQINQPRTDDNDDSTREGQRGNQEADEANDSGRDEEEEEEEEEEEDEKDEKEDGNRGEIPSSLRNWLPFP